jgi:hypothetical protein
MAYAAKLDAYDWNSDESEMAAAAAQGLLMSNHSYGLITGWAYGDFDGLGSSRWFWWGDESDTICADFGLYSQQARDWDLIANNAPNYLIVKAAGNDRGQGPSPGSTHRAWSNSQGNWVNSTVTRQKDGGPLGYDCISHAGVAKNVLSIGAVQGITGAYTGPSQVVPSTFHGWGPTDDGMTLEGPGPLTKLALTNGVTTGRDGLGSNGKELRKRPENRGQCPFGQNPDSSRQPSLVDRANLIDGRDARFATDSSLRSKRVRAPGRQRHDDHGRQREVELIGRNHHGWPRLLHLRPDRRVERHEKDLASLRHHHHRCMLRRGH